MSAQPNQSFDATSRAFKTFYEAKLKLHGIVGSSFMFLHDVLKRASLLEMWQPQLPIALDAMLMPDGRDRKNHIGLTYFIEDNFGQHFIGHSGGQNSFISHFYLRPDNRTAYLVAFNTHAIPREKNKT